MALAAARSRLNRNHARAAEGHSQAWPSHHEVVNNLRELSFDAEEGERIINHQTKRSTKMISKFFRDETGLELSEYAVAAALVAIAVVGAFSALGVAIDGKIRSLGTTISTGK